ncbi:MAG TPA: diacylglycerol kinase family protein [Thermomicrobiales bacterium]|nr:diacylglycerol kinase family protein [Thermomicrobiales bacterium]
MPAPKKFFLVRNDEGTPARLRGAISGAAHAGPGGPQRVVAILNPIKAGYTEAKAHLIVECTEAGWPLPVFLDTTIEDPGRGQALAALERGADVIVAGGGDGTMREVAEVLVQHGGASPPPPPLGIVPLGTGNLLARNLGMTVSSMSGPILRNVRTALFGMERRIDTIRITLDGGEPHISLIFSGVGFDAATIGATRDDLKKRLGPLGWLAYAEAGLRQLQHSRARTAVSLTFGDAEPAAYDVVSVMLGNGSSIPAGIEFVPGALLDDGHLDVIVVTPANLHEWMRVATKIVTRHKWDVSQLQYRRCQRVEIRATEPIPTELDGDPHGVATHIVAEILPASLTVRTQA